MTDKEISFLIGLHENVIRNGSIRRTSQGKLFLSAKRTGSCAIRLNGGLFKEIEKGKSVNLTDLVKQK